MRPQRPFGRCRQCMSWHELYGNFCPLITKAYSMYNAEKKFKQHYFGEAPSPFIGRYGYPKVNVGLLGVPDEKNSWIYDAPRFWSEQNYGISKVVDFRSSMVNSREKAEIKEKTKIIDLAQQVALSVKPVDVEVQLKKTPKFGFSVNPFTMPMGPGESIVKANITSNAKIPRKLDKAVSDTDLKAADAIAYLYKNSFDENQLSKVLSVGSLGIGKNRKLVPTRWSITATDDTIGKELISEIKDFKEIDAFIAFSGSYLGNYYLALLFPEKWSYELFEIASPQGNYGTDHENYSGRKDYAENTAGGYYAARLAVLEKLKKMKRQASVLLLRFITNEYAIPLGVWVVRQASRKSMDSKPTEFMSKDLMVGYANLVAVKKFGVNLKEILGTSKLLKEMKEQRKLFEF